MGSEAGLESYGPTDRQLITPAVAPALESSRTTISVVSAPVVCFPFDRGCLQSLRDAPSGHFHNESFYLFVRFFSQSKPIIRLLLKRATPPMFLGGFSNQECRCLPECSPSPSSASPSPVTGSSLRLPPGPPLEHPLVSLQPGHIHSGSPHSSQRGFMACGHFFQTLSVVPHHAPQSLPPMEALCTHCLHLPQTHPHHPLGDWQILSSVQAPFPALLSLRASQGWCVLRAWPSVSPIRPRASHGPGRRERVCCRDPSSSPLGPVPGAAQ